jgi:hypothetical protein
MVRKSPIKPHFIQEAPLYLRRTCSSRILLAVAIYLFFVVIVIRQSIIDLSVRNLHHHLAGTALTTLAHRTHLDDLFGIVVQELQPVF